MNEGLHKAKHEIGVVKFRVGFVGEDKTTLADEVVEEDIRHLGQTGVLMNANIGQKQN